MTILLLRYRDDIEIYWLGSVTYKIVRNTNGNVGPVDLSKNENGGVGLKE